MLPSNAAQLADSFTRLDPSRKAELLAHLQAVPAARLQAVTGQIAANGGDEADFVTHVLGKNPADKAGKADKAINPIHTA